MDSSNFPTGTGRLAAVLSIEVGILGECMLDNWLCASNPKLF
jgi:hypothetical protein